MPESENISVPLDESLTTYITRLGRSPSSLLRIFDRGDFYSLHRDDAKFVATEFLKSPEALKHLGKDKVPSVAVSKLNYEALLRNLLLVRLYSVELHGKEGNSWKLTAKGSPGNLSQFEEILFNTADMDNSAGVVCVSVETGGTFSVVYIDVMVREISFCTLTDTEQMCTLESLLVQISPRECLVSPSVPEYKRLSQILSRLHVLEVPRKGGGGGVDQGRKDLARLLGETNTGLSSKFTDPLLGCASSLVKYLEISPADTRGYTLTELAPHLSMRLDGAAFQGLNVMPASTMTEPSHASLWGVLNQCGTAQGQRLLGQWLKSPLLDPAKIKERHDVVEMLVEEGGMRQQLGSSLKRVPDFFRITKKLDRGRGNLQDCYKLYMAIKQIPRVLEPLCTYDGVYGTLVNCLYITRLRELEEDFSSFLELVETTVDLEQCDVGEYVIKHTFDEGLAELRGQMDDLTGEIDAEFSDIAHQLKTDKGKGVKLEVSPVHGHCCRVTRKDEKGVRQKRAFEILSTKKDGVYFTTSTLRDLGSRYRVAQKEYTTLQGSIVAEVVKVAAGYTDPLLSLNNLIANLDVMVGFATAANNAPIPYTRPTVHPRGRGLVKLTGSRHPCVEGNSDITFISNDIHLDKEGARFLLITGPNMGGKSTYIRQVGVSCLLAQIGSFVPCEAAEISILSSIYCRVGASDSQSRGVSTFMSEMLETSAILSCADSDSLIIIDELGRGTSTYDGFGLAWSISNHIVKEIGCLALFATHFHEMTNLAEVQPAVSNYHVSALVEGDQLALLYKVQPGPCDQSFGVHVAKLANFPEHVVEMARVTAEDLDQFQFIPAVCLDGEKHGEFVTATGVIDRVLRALAGAAEGQESGVLERCLVEHAEVLRDNNILSRLMKKRKVQ
eukprot:sb/3461891/